MVSQDTSAYGVDLGYRTGFWDGRPIKTRFYELAKAWAISGHGYGCTTSIPIPTWTR